ncbi:hypothetical protein [Streptomyces wuyuanensis]|uniref:hypothetical protein n=1 Tax=Streptomyces wuyuanensis TaxID=1196353 RepID=UPI0037AB6E3B
MSIRDVIEHALRVYYADSAEPNAIARDVLAQYDGESQRLQTERDRYRIAWRMAYQRAQGRGWAADRAGALARDAQEALQHMLFAVIAGQLGRKAAIDEAVARTRREVLGDDLNPSSLVLDAQSYRQLADDVLATMTDPDRWDLDGAEPWVLGQYLKHLAAQLALAVEFRVPLPEGLGGGYGEVVVQRESAGSDRWAVTDGAVSGLRAWRDPDGWQYVAEIGRREAFAYGLDEALDLADEVARIERERHDARIRAHREGGAQ